MSKSEEYLFRNAPEGTTHFGPAESSYVETWFKINGEDQQYVCLDEIAGWKQYRAGIPLERLQMLIERPKQPQAWSGEWPPRVGDIVTTQVHDSKFKGCTMKVLAVTEYGKTGHAVMTACVHGESLGELSGWIFGLEPLIIKTPEQLAAEEREMAIEDLIRVTCINHGEAARIYDAGYRKQ